MQESDDALNLSAPIFMLGVGTFIGIGFFIRNGLFNIYSDNVSYNLKVSYFKAALEKDAAYFDLHDQSEFASKIAKEASAV